MLFPASRHGPLRKPLSAAIHYRESYYALPRILLTALDTAALIRSALDRERYARLLGSPALAELVEAAKDLIEGLTQGVEPCPPSADRGAAWRRHYAQASATLARAGLSLRGDLEAGAEDYAVLSAQWDRSLRSLAEFMLYEWEEIEPQAPGERSG